MKIIMSDGALFEHRIGAALKALMAKPSQESLTCLAECYIDAAAHYAMARRWDYCYDCIKCAELTNVSSESIVTKRDAYLDFCEWWGFDSFENTDFQVFDKRDSLAESAYIAYSRRIIPLTIAEYTFDFYIDFIEKKIAHHFTVYADYHICRFMIRVGFDAKDVLRGYRNYIKQKHSKSWSWIALSHLFDKESIEYQACMMFALECEGNLEDDAATLDYRAVCHRLFADSKDADTALWRGVQERLRKMRNGGWTERKRKKETQNKEILYKLNK